MAGWQSSIPTGLSSGGNAQQCVIGMRRPDTLTATTLVELDHEARDLRRRGVELPSLKMKVQRISAVLQRIKKGQDLLCSGGGLYSPSDCYRLSQNLCLISDDQ